ncbi:MAG: hypothetical protein H7835_04760 [Magnetococcus sp. XQGC-1]
MIRCRWLLAFLLMFDGGGLSVAVADEAGPGTRIHPATRQPAPSARERRGPAVQIGPATRQSGEQDEGRMRLLRQLIRDGDRILSPGWSDQGYISSRWQEDVLIRTGEELLVHLEQPPVPGSLYLIYRPGFSLTDPLHGTLLGSLARNLGKVQITGEEVNGQWRARIIAIQGEVQLGDRLLHEQNITDDFQIHTHAPAPVSGRILAVADEREVAGAGQVVLVGVGRRDRVSQGLVMSVQRTPGPRVDPVTGRGITNRAHPIGEATLFLIGERASFALLGPTSLPVSRGDAVSSR